MLLDGSCRVRGQALGNDDVPIVDEPKCRIDRAGRGASLAE